MHFSEHLRTLTHLPTSHAHLLVRVQDSFHNDMHATGALYNHPKVDFSPLTL